MSGLGEGHLGRKAMLAPLLLQLALATVASAQSQLSRLFPPRPTGYVTDVAGVIDAASASAITDKIQRLRDATGAEIAVVTLPDIGDYAPSDVALEIGRAWGVGAKADVGDERRNAGVVVLLVPKGADRPGPVLHRDRPRGGRNRHRRGRGAHTRPYSPATLRRRIRARAQGRSRRAREPDRARIRRHGHNPHRR